MQPPMVGTSSRYHHTSALAAETRPLAFPVNTNSSARVSSRKTTLARAPANPTSAAQNTMPAKPSWPVKTRRSREMSDSGARANSVTGLCTARNRRFGYLRAAEPRILRDGDGRGRCAVRSSHLRPRRPCPHRRRRPRSRGRRRRSRCRPCRRSDRARAPRHRPRG